MNTVFLIARYFVEGNVYIPFLLFMCLCQKGIDFTCACECACAGQLTPEGLKHSRLTFSFNLVYDVCV